MVTDRRSAEFVIVGSGAGGGTLARELAKKGKDVLVIEKGPRADKMGTDRTSFNFYDKRGLSLLKSKEGTMILRTLMAGGSTAVSCGCGVPCLEDELLRYGVSLHHELEEAIQDTRTEPIAEGLLSEASKRLREAASDLGITMKPMPKFIDAAKCKACGNCVNGCVNSAKWTSLCFLDEANTLGLKLLTNTRVIKVTTSNGKATGVIGRGPKGRVEIDAGTVVLAAGGIGTPIILQNSGIHKAGQQFFCDLCNITYGIAAGEVNQHKEPLMSLIADQFYESKGLILSPDLMPRLGMIMTHPMRFFVGKMPRNRMLGILTKIKDELEGRITADGKIEKPVTASDKAKLDEGASISREIIIKGGADPRSIFIERPFGAHPGGTAAIGQIVNENLETEIEGLYVSDASVLPTSPGLPPIITLIALSKRLAKHLLAK